MISIERRTSSNAAVRKQNGLRSRIVSSGSGSGYVTNCRCLSSRRTFSLTLWFSCLSSLPLLWFLRSLLRCFCCCSLLSNIKGMPAGGGLKHNGQAPIWVKGHSAVGLIFKWTGGCCAREVEIPAAGRDGRVGNDPLGERILLWLLLWLLWLLLLYLMLLLLYLMLLLL